MDKSEKKIQYSNRGHRDSQPPTVQERQQQFDEDMKNNVDPLRTRVMQVIAA